MDKTLQKNEYKAQTYLIFLCWLMYVASYVARYSYNANITVIAGAFSIQDYSKTGLVTTCFFFAYGIGQVVCGLLCKRFHKRFVLFAAMLISAMVNLLIFLVIDFTFYKYLWLVNGAALCHALVQFDTCFKRELGNKPSAWGDFGDGYDGCKRYVYRLWDFCALYAFWRLAN